MNEDFENELKKEIIERGEIIQSQIKRIDELENELLIYKAKITCFKDSYDLLKSNVDELKKIAEDFKR